MSEIDKEIKDHEQLYKNARDRDDEDELVKELPKQLRDKQIERSARLEVASINARALRSQIAGIKETIYRVLYINLDKTLGERIKTIFREQGVTKSVY